MTMTIFKMITIFIKREDLEEFKELAKANNVRHGPFHKTWKTLSQQVGYEIDIFDPGSIETFLRLKYTEVG